MEGMESVIQEFLSESLEGIEQLDRDLVSLRSACADEEAIMRIYRVVHTIKGTSGFLMFSNLERLNQAAQTVLGLIRDGALAQGPEVADDLAAAVDATKTMLASIQSNGNDGDNEYMDLVERLSHYN
jgi:two-component system chemotaxis sensor kinase CheA